MIPQHAGQQWVIDGCIIAAAEWGVQFQGPNCKSSTSCFAFSFKVCQSEKNDQEKTYDFWPI